VVHILYYIYVQQLLFANLQSPKAKQSKDLAAIALQAVTDIKQL
jgi:hypothetical protein